MQKMEEALDCFYKLHNILRNNVQVLCQIASMSVLCQFVLFENHSSDTRLLRTVHKQSNCYLKQATWLQPIRESWPNLEICTILKATNHKHFNVIMMLVHYQWNWINRFLLIAELSFLPIQHWSNRMAGSVLHWRTVLRKSRQLFWACFDNATRRGAFSAIVRMHFDVFFQHDLGALATNDGIVSSSFRQLPKSPGNVQIHSSKISR